MNASRQTTLPSSNLLSGSRTAVILGALGAWSCDTVMLKAALKESMGLTLKTIPRLPKTGRGTSYYYLGDAHTVGTVRVLMCDCDAVHMDLMKGIPPMMDEMIFAPAPMHAYCGEVV